MNNQKHLSENRYVLLIITLLGTTSLLFQNCSPLKSNNTNSGFDLEVTQFAEKTTKFVLSNNSGTVSPEYQFKINYEIDFASKNFNLTVSKGALAAGLPNPLSKILNDLQLSQVRSLISKVKAKACPSGDMQIGGGADTIGLFTSTTSTAPDVVIYGSNCTGLNSSYFQSSSGFAELSTYIKSL